MDEKESREDGKKVKQDVVKEKRGIMGEVLSIYAVAVMGFVVWVTWIARP